MNTKSEKRFSFEKIKRYIITHKKISIVILLLLLVIIYRLFISGGSVDSIHYTLATVQKGTISSTIVGAGQVSASNEVSLSSQVSGEVLSVAAKVGQELKKGDLIVQINPHDAEIDLQNAKISLQKLLKPTDAATMLSAKNAVEDARQAEEKAQLDLTKSYNDGFTTISNTFLDLPDVLSGLNDLLYGRDGYISSQSVQSYSDLVRSYRTTAGLSYDAANNAYTTVLAEYKNISRSSAPDDVKRVLDDVYNMTGKVSQALKDAKTAVDYFKNVQQQQSSSSSSAQNYAAATAAQSDITTWTNKVTQDLSSLLSSQNTIVSAQNNILSTKRDTETKQATLKKLQDGPDELDVESQQLALKQKEYEYEKYFLRAPFDGVVGSLSVKQTDRINSGTDIGTFITKQKIAEITLNEVDVSKVAVGNKATLTFDALDGLTISGTVAEVNLVGTTAQGVVSYGIKIELEAQDTRVKSGMSTTATITTQTRQDVLLVPNSAVKSQGDVSYVQVMKANESIPTNQKVTTGLSDDTNTEIISGLQEGDKVVEKTTTGSSLPTQSSKTTSTKNILQGVGGGSGRGMFP